MMQEMEDMMNEYRDLVDEINWMHAELHGAEMEAEKLRKVIVSMNILLDDEAERIRAYYERLRSYSLLIDLLRDDWGIDVSWDGLRKFWCISLTEREVQAREQLEAENERLRSCLSDTEEHASAFLWENKQLEEERDKLRELVRDMWNQARLCDANAHIEGMRLTEQAREEYMSRMEELGVEV